VRVRFVCVCAHTLAKGYGREGNISGARERAGHIHRHPSRRTEKSGTLHRAGAGANVMAVDRGGALSRHFQHRRRRRRALSASLGISRSPYKFIG